MRKINIFNRHTANKFPFAGEGVPGSTRWGSGCWRNAPRITPRPFGRTPSWKEGERRCTGVWVTIAAILIATPSFATDPDPAVIDRQIVASKAYVDTKQDIIETGLVEYTDAEEQIDYNVPALVSYGTGTNNADGIQGNKIGILGINENIGGLNSYDFLDLWDDEESGYLDNFVPTVRAVSHIVSDIWAVMPYWTALSWNVGNDNGANRTNAINTYNTTFSSNGANNTWGGTSSNLINGQFLANSLALKQNKLPALDTNLVLGQAGQSVLAPTTAGNVTQVALWDADGAEPDAWDVDTYFSDATADERNAIRYSIPTVGAVEVGLYPKQNKLSAKSTGNAAPKGNQAVVLNTDGNPSNVYTTAGKNLALTEKSGAAAVMNYIDGTTASATFASGQGLTEAQVKATLVSLELMKDVYGALHTEIQNAAPTGTAGNVAIYDANTGVLGNGRPTADAPAHDAQTGALTNGTAIATINAIETKQNKMTCAGWDSETHTDEHCWLWSIE